MSTSTDTSAASELRHVPLGEIQVEEGANPRTRFDDAALRELAGSIARHGVIQPLVVSCADGGYTLIAGERRYRAAKLAGLDRVPVTIKDGEGPTFELAVDENLHRQALDPVEEAHAFQAILQSEKLSKKQLAERVSKKPQYVNDRLRLLQLPERARPHFASGVLPVRVAAELMRIAKVSEPVASCLAELVADGHATVDELEEQPDRLIGCLGDHQWPDPEPIALHVGYYAYALDDLPLPTEGCEEIRERYDALGQPVSFRFSDEDSDAARGYGCLLELKRKTPFDGSSRYITDPAFIADRVRLKLDQHEKELHDKSRETNPNQPQQAATSNENDPSASDLEQGEEQEQERRKLERQQRAEAKERATTANFELGRKLQLRYDTVKITAPLARLLALLILDRDADKLAGRGLRYVREDWQISETIERRGTPVENARYPESREAATQLYAWISRARTPEQILGRLLQTLIAAHTADQNAVADSSRVYWQLPDGSGYPDSPSSEIPVLLDRLANPVRPRPLAPDQHEQPAAEAA